MPLDDRPSRTNDPTPAPDWPRRVELAGPASLLVVIHGLMSQKLRQQVDPEDVLQEALLHAWRDRGNMEWRGAAAFRRWLLQIIHHRIQDFSKGHRAQKRGGGEANTVPLAAPSGTTSPGVLPKALHATTTPSRVATERERARIMRVALGSLPDELREIVRLRLFHELTSEEIAKEMAIGVSAVKHRFLKGLQIYRSRLRAEITLSRGFRDGG